MKQNEFNQKVEGIVKILEESDIILRCIKLSKNGERNDSVGSDYHNTTYKYFFKSKDEKHYVHISSGDAYHWGQEQDVIVKYDGNNVLRAIQCKKVTKERFLLTEKEPPFNCVDLSIFVKQSDNINYEVSIYKKGEWEDLISEQEKNIILKSKEIEKPKIEPELDQKIVESLNESFKI